jgi:hypothetical protein
MTTIPPESSVDKNFAHSGNPCRYCKREHDEVAPGPCPGIVAYRPPLAGEWFVGGDGRVIQAMFDFVAQSFSILEGYPYA